MILETIGTIQINLSLIWRFLAPHPERMPYGFKRDRRVLVWPIVSSFYGIFSFLMGCNSGGVRSSEGILIYSFV